MYKRQAFHKGDVPVIHDHEVEAQIEAAFLFQLMESPEELQLVAHVAAGAVPDAAYALGVGGGDALAECALVFFDGVLGDDAQGEIVRLPDEQAAREAVRAEVDFALPACGEDVYKRQLFRSASAEKDPEGRKALYAALQERLSREHVALWLCTIPYATIRNRNVLHVADQPFGVLSPLDEACWKRP